MIYPENFEHKIGFDEIRQWLRGHCLSSLGTDWVDNKLAFRSDHNAITSALARVEEWRKFDYLCGDGYEPDFYDLREALMRVRPERSHMDESNMLKLRRSLLTVASIVSLIRKPQADDVDTKLESLLEMSDGVADFKDLAAQIDKVLNEYGKVRDTASPALLQIRHNMETASRSIGTSLREIIKSGQQDGWIERDVAPTMRDGRLVIPVAPAARRRLKGIVHDESASGRTVFVEPAAVVEANNRVRELQASEQREVLRLLTELTSLVRPRIPELLDAFRFLAEVDFLRAVSAFCDTTEAVVPRIVSSRAIDWRAARHPLLQRALKMRGAEIVPLDIRLKGGERLLIISGPNAGGKSVCLKTVGLLQYMLQCGLPIPVAENSTAGIFDGIFADIGDEQSLSDDLSTYSAHLVNMKEMMAHATRSSLLLIDEFGSGTEPQIGAALAEAVLLRFVEIGAWGIVTTHYENLKRVADVQPAVVNGAMLFDRAAMQPLFCLQVGNAGSSFAVEMAQRVGLPADIIETAQKLVGENYILADRYLQDTLRDKLFWQRKRQSIERREEQLEHVMSDYEGRLSRLSKEQREVMARARGEAEQLVRSANARIENTIRTIKESQAEAERTRKARSELAQWERETLGDGANSEPTQIDRQMERIRRRQERRKQRGKTDSAALSATATGSAPQQDAAAAVLESGPLTVGDWVRIKGQNTVGLIESIGSKESRVLVGMMHTNVKLSRLERVAPPPAEDRSKKAATFLSRATRDAMAERRLQFKPELDIRGYRADEAMRELAAFMDDALALNYPRVRILHGTGGGVLREVVRKYAASLPGVAHVHDEHVQFGGAGITVIEMD